MNNKNVQGVEVMKLIDLLKVYPTATLEKSQVGLDSCLVLTDGIDTIAIPNDVLSESERDLLELMYGQQEHSNSPWFNRLINHQDTTNLTDVESCRLIHFEVVGKNFDKQLWLETFESGFIDVVDDFFISDKSGIVVVRDEVLDKESISGLINALDSDFNTKTSIFLGTPILQRIHLDALYEEEKTLFNLFKHQQPLTDYLSVYTPHFLSKLTHDSTTAKMLAYRLANDQEMQEIIDVMWHAQGNVSLAAGKLYIHRNTLNHKLDKFIDQTSFNLRDIHQLALLYLIESNM